MSQALKWIGMRKDEQSGKEAMFVEEESGDQVLGPLGNNEVNLISIFGAARQGKSFLMNLLSGKQDLFKISNLREPCTQGVDISRHFVSLREFSALDSCERVNEDRMIGFVDAEGQGDRDISYDSRLVTPILLASKAVIFNWKDSLQIDRILNLLGVLARAAQGVEGNADSTIFGHLHIVFRDWNFVNTTPGEVLRDIFAKEKGRSSEVSVRNQSRATIEEAFESVTVWLFPAPIENTSGLSEKIRFSQLQPKFQAQLRDLRRSLSVQLKKPMLFNNKVLTARRLKTLMPTLVETLNRDEVIMPEAIFMSLLRVESEKAVIELTQDISLLKEEIKESTIQEFKSAEELTAIFDKRCTDYMESFDASRFPNEMAQEIYEKVGIFAHQKLEELKRECNDLLQEQIAVVSETVDSLLNDWYSNVHADLPIQESEIDEKSQEVFSEVKKYFSSLPINEVVRKEQSRIQEKLEAFVTKLKLENMKKVQEAQQNMETLIGKVAANAKQILISHIEQNVAFSFSKFHADVVEKLFNQELPAGIYNAELLAQRKDQEIDNLEDIYENQIAAIKKGLLDDAQQDLENSLEAKLSKPCDINAMQDIVNKELKKAKKDTANKLAGSGWDVYDEDLEDLKSTLTNCAAKIFDTKKHLVESATKQRSMELYNQALSIISSKGLEEITSSLPLEHYSAVEERFNLVCEKEALRLCEHPEISESPDKLFRRLSTDSSPVLEQLQLLNRVADEKVRAQAEAQNERYLREQHLAQAGEQTKTLKAQLAEMQLQHSELQKANQAEKALRLAAEQAAYQSAVSASTAAKAALEAQQDLQRAMDMDNDSGMRNSDNERLSSTPRRRLSSASKASVDVESSPKKLKQEESPARSNRRTSIGTSSAVAEARREAQIAQIQRAEERISKLKTTPKSSKKTTPSSAKKKSARKASTPVAPPPAAITPKVSKTPNSKSNRRKSMGTSAALEAARRDAAIAQQARAEERIAQLTKSGRKKQKQ